MIKPAVNAGFIFSVKFCNKKEQSAQFFQKDILYIYVSNT